MVKLLINSDSGNLSSLQKIFVLLHINVNSFVFSATKNYFSVTKRWLREEPVTN